MNPLENSVRMQGEAERGGLSARGWGEGVRLWSEKP